MRGVRIVTGLCVFADALDPDNAERLWEVPLELIAPK